MTYLFQISRLFCVFSLNETMDTGYTNSKVKIFLKERIRMETVNTGEIFTIVDENEQEQDVEVLGKLTVDGEEYFAVAFVEELLIESEEDIDVFFFHIEPNGEWASIEDDEEFERISTLFENTH